MQLLSFYNWVMATATTSTGVKGGAATGHVSWDLEVCAVTVDQFLFGERRKQEEYILRSASSTKKMDAMSGPLNSAYSRRCLNDRNDTRYWRSSSYRDHLFVWG